MITSTTLIICSIALILLLIGGLVTHQPILLVMALIVAGVLFFVLLPKYQNQQAAMAQGMPVMAQVKEIRWSHHWVGSDRQPETRYEIIATWQNPQNGKTVEFVSEPLATDPKPHIQNNQVKVTVSPQNPEQYVMDTSFVPASTTRNFH